MISKGSLIAIFAAALVLGVVGTGLMRRLAFHLDVLDHPGARKHHLRPTPLLGGVAIYAAVVGAMLMYPGRWEFVQLTGIFVSATWISFWGLWDDRWGLNPYLKLAAQLAAGGILIFSGIRVFLPVPEWGDLALTLFWIVGITNAFNLLDNMDGLAGGIGAVASGYFLLMAAINGQYLVGALAAALLGACLGFLVFNFNPARIFMGDSGSLFLGFMLAVIGIKLRFPNNVPSVTWMVPVLVLGIAILDTTLVFVSRLRRGKNPLTSPGKDHISHRLISLGLSHRRAVTAHYLAASGLGAIGLLVSLAEARTAYALAALAGLSGISALAWLERSQGAGR